MMARGYEPEGFFFCGFAKQPSLPFQRATEAGEPGEITECQQPQGEDAPGSVF